MDITVPFHGIYQPGQLSMTPEAAEKLISDLRSQLKQVRHDWSQYETPAVTEDGFLTYPAVREFFEQAYTSPGKLDYHAGRVFQALVRSGMRLPYDENDGVVVVCDACGLNVREHVGDGIAPRSHGTHDMKVDVQSLKDFAASYVLNGNLNNTITHDLEGLLNHL